jgi:hypothetical protein
MTGGQKGEESQPQNVQAGRDNYVAGRDLTIVYPPATDQAWADEARAELKSRESRRRKDQARRVVVSQELVFVDADSSWRSIQRAVASGHGFLPLPSTIKPYYLLKVTIANHGTYVIHDVDVEWRRDAVPTGEHTMFTGILPGRTEQASIIIPGADSAKRFRMTVRFRDKDDVLWQRDTASGDIQEVSEGSEAGT